MEEKKKTEIVNRITVTQLLLTLYASIFLILKEQKIDLLYFVGIFVGVCLTVFFESIISNASCRKIQKHIDKAKY